MKTTTLAVVLSTLALGGVAMLYVKVDDLGEQLKMSRADRGASQRDTRSEAQPEYVIRRSDEGSGAQPAWAKGSGTPDPTIRKAGEEPKSVEQRLADLERKEEARSRNPGWSAPGFRTTRFARTVDDLGKQLELTSNQKDRIANAVSRGKARIEEVLAIPGADGKTIKELREESRRKIREAISSPEKNAGALVTLAMAGHKRMGEKIPGRNETYRQEIDRIKKETRDEINGTLDAAQQEKFKDTRIDPMLGESGSRMAFSTSVSVGDDVDSPMGGIMIAEDVTIDSEAESPEKKGKDE